MLEIYQPQTVLFLWHRWWHLHRLVSREAAHDQTWCRCEWLVDAGNFHELSLQKNDRFLSLTKKVRCRYSLCTLTAHTQTHKMQICPSAADGRAQLLCKKILEMSSLTCQYFSDLTSDFWALTWAKLRSKIYSSFKMISGPTLSTKYMPTCKKTHNHRKIPLL